MKKLTRLLMCAMVASFFVLPTPATASDPLDQTTLTLCTSLRTGYQLISKTGKCNERIYEARTWFQKGSAPSGTPGSKLIDLTTCISKSSLIPIIRTRSTCNSRTTTTALWQRPLGPPVSPSITSVAMGLLGTATLNIAAPIEDGGAFVTSYLVTSSPGAIAATFTPAQIKAAKITGLSPGTTYSFTVVAINSQGSSPSSIASAPTLAPTIPSAPSITQVVATGTNSAQLSFSAPLDNGGSPITSYVATSSPASLQTIVYQSAGGTINITNLSYSTTYTFTLRATNAAGSSLPSAISASITTATPPPPPEPVAVAPALAAPAFTLSSSSETRTVNTAATGFTINSTGGAIASFAISATPAGMSFSTSTGALTGTPTTVASATAYTITATNATGSATATFTLTVAAALAAPAFTLSSSSETRTVNTAATGFTINSTGGAIASFAISATPAGMSFSTSTGALTGTPTSVAGATTYTVTATNATGSATATFTLTVSPGAASAAAITTQPTGAASGSTLATQPVIRIVDASGNTVTSSTVNVVASIASGSGGTLSGTTTVAAVAGIATFTNLVITGTAGNFTLAFTPTSLTPVTSSSLAITAAITYAIGSTGPGGGKIFYVAPAGTTFPCGADLAATCKYLELAPTSGTNAWTDGTYAWSSNFTSVGASAQDHAIGTGYKNTLAIINQSGTANSAATIARAFRGPNNLTDWYLPSINELNKFYENRATVGGFVGSTYWSSSEANAYNAWYQNFDYGYQTFDYKHDTRYVRPVRAF